MQRQTSVSSQLRGPRKLGLCRTINSSQRPAKTADTGSWIDDSSSTKMVFASSNFCCLYIVSAESNFLRFG